MIIFANPSILDLRSSNGPHESWWCDKDEGTLKFDNVRFLNVAGKRKKKEKSILFIKHNLSSLFFHPIMKPYGYPSTILGLYIFGALLSYMCIFSVVFKYPLLKFKFP